MWDLPSIITRNHVHGSGTRFSLLQFNRAFLTLGLVHQRTERGRFLLELTQSSMDYAGNSLFASSDFMQRVDNGIQNSLGTGSEADDSDMYKQLRKER